MDALTTDLEQTREEMAFHFGASATPTEGVAHWTAYAGLGLFGLGAALGLTGTFGPELAVGTMLVGAVTTVLAGVTAAHRYHRRRDLIGERWLRFWRSRLGTWVARLASLGLKRLPADAAPTYRHTPTAIGMAAERLYENLPEAARKVLEDLPHVVWRLESQTQRMRALVATLEASAASEPEASANQRLEARDAAQLRLAEGLTALESIRLQLIRLQSGTGTIEGVTADLAAAREIADAVDRLLEARREIQETLHH